MIDRELGADLQRAFEARYPCGSIESYSRIEGDPFSLAFRVETACGTYCLKRHRPDKTPERLDFEETLSACLTGHGFNLIPLMVPTRDGALHIKVNDEVWSVHDYVHADRPFLWTYPDWTAAHCREAGQALARLHDTSRHCLSLLQRMEQYEGALNSVLPSLRARLAAALDLAGKQATNGNDDLNALFFANRELPPAIGSEPFVEAGLPRRPGRTPARLLEELAETLAEIADMETRSGQEPVLVHGDYHPGNLLFVGSSLRAILDFEYAHMEQRPYDLAYAAVMFCTRWPARLQSHCDDDKLDGSLRTAYLEAFLSGYRKQCNPASDSEASAALASADAFCDAYLPYLRLSCYLLIYWLIGEHARATTHTGLPLARALRHSLRALDHLSL